MGAARRAARALAHGALHGRPRRDRLRRRCGAGRSSDLEAFWAAIWERFDVGGDVRARARRRVDAGRGVVPGRRAQLRRAALPRQAGRPRRDPARVRAARRWSSGPGASCASGPARIRAGLRARGVGRGDRVAAYMPNVPETIAAFLATASLGAVWSSAAPEFGARSVIDRFGQIEPKVLLAVDGYRYGGRDFDRRDAVDGDRAPRSARRSSASATSTAAAGRTASSATPRARVRAGAVRPPAVGALLVGTTGLPKAIVQGQGGILLEHLKKMHLHLDAHEGDRVFWFTTTGWMMWNFLVSVLLTDAAIVLYDGNPGAPDLDRLWDLAEESEMTCFGTSASYIAACMKAGVEPAAGRDLSRAARGRLDRLAAGARGLRVGLRARRARHLAVLHLAAAPTSAPRSSAAARCCPSTSASCRRARSAPTCTRSTRTGDAVIDEVGELVITAADAVDAAALLGRRGRRAAARGLLRHLPGRLAPRRLDPDHRARHRGHLRPLGLDDQPRRRAHGHERDLPRRAGRAGGRRRARRRRAARRARRTGCRCSSCCATAPSSTTTLVAEIRRRVREDCSPRHVPSEVRAIAEVPRTLSGKVLEVPVKRILMGEPPEQAASRDSLANPAALDYFVELAAE